MSLDDLYRRVIMDHYQHPRNRGHLGDDSVKIALNNPTCGDRIEVEMKIDDKGKIEDVKFDGEGCSISLSSASMMTDVIKGLPVGEALGIAEQFSRLMQGEDVDLEALGDIQALQGVTKFPARIKCATLAWKAMQQGIQQYDK